MSTPNSGSNVRSGQGDENRYHLVNTVAQQAKIIMAHDPNPALASNHAAIREAMRKNRNQRAQES